MNRRDDWKAVDEAIEARDKITLTTHVNPDGDAIGSELAFYYYLKKLGKDVRIINISPTPVIFKFMDPDESRIKVYSDEDDDWIAGSELIFMLDISSIDRLGKMSAAINRSRAIKICIDHHFTNHGLFEINVIDSSASATGELIYEYLHRLSNEILDYPIVEAIYIAILTDTGSFRFSNSTPRSHIITADLIERGIKPREIYGKVYESDSWEKMRLLGKALNRLKTDETKKIAWTTIPDEIMKSIGAKREDVEGIVEQISVIWGVNITLLFLELPTGKVKVSLRSKGNLSINQIAEQFDGGGHRHAAGILFPKIKLEDAVLKVVGACKKII